MATPGVLYVFFHGLCAGRDTGNEIEVALPDVPGHVFKAGAWLAETEITSGRVLHLTGVNSGSAKLAQANVGIDLPDCSLTSKKRAATLRLPLPAEIRGFLRTTAPTTPFPVPPRIPPLGRFVAWREDTQVGWESVATVVILKYNYQDESAVILDGQQNWEPSATGGAMSLHIFAVSEGPEGEEHERETQNVLRKVIGGYPGIKFDKPSARPGWRGTRDQKYGALTGLKPTGGTNAMQNS